MKKKKCNPIAVRLGRSKKKKVGRLAVTFSSSLLLLLLIFAVHRTCLPLREIETARGSFYPLSLSLSHEVEGIEGGRGEKFWTADVSPRKEENQKHFCFPDKKAIKSSPGVLPLLSSLPPTSFAIMLLLLLLLLLLLSC